MWSNVRPSSWTRSIGSWWRSRFSRSYLRWRSRVWRRLVSLMSIAVIRASGSRSAYLAACEVPQPATRISWPPRSRLGRPQEMKQRPPTVRVAVQVAMLVQAGERRRIRHRLVEGVHVLRDTGAVPSVGVLAHSDQSFAANDTRGRRRGRPARAGQPRQQAIGSSGRRPSSFSMTWSMLKLAGFWLGGNSLKLEIHWATKPWAGTSRKTRRSSQSL